jgi:hypothetical protein
VNEPGSGGNEFESRGLDHPRANGMS